MRNSDKIYWIQKIFTNSFYQLRVLKEENYLDFLRNKYNAKRGKKIVALLNPGFKYVVHLVSEESHKYDLKAKEIRSYWENKGFKVFFLESFNDLDFFKLKEVIKEYKKTQIKGIESYLKNLEKTNT